jgi:hypothetical protein
MKYLSIFLCLFLYFSCQVKNDLAKDTAKTNLQQEFNSTNLPIDTIVFSDDEIDFFSKTYLQIDKLANSVCQFRYTVIKNKENKILFELNQNMEVEIPERYAKLFTAKHHCDSFIDEEAKWYKITYCTEEKGCNDSNTLLKIGNWYFFETSYSVTQVAVSAFYKKGDFIKYHPSIFVYRGALNIYHDEKTIVLLGNAGNDAHTTKCTDEYEKFGFGFMRLVLDKETKLNDFNAKMYFVEEKYLPPIVIENYQKSSGSDTSAIYSYIFYRHLDSIVVNTGNYCEP